MSPLHLQPLYNNRVLHSRQRVESHSWIAEQLCDYGLRWRGGPVDTQVFQTGTPRLAMYSMQYGDEVDIAPTLYRDFCLVHLSLHGAMEVEADGERIGVPQGQVLISSPTRDIRLRWQQGCEQLILRVPHDLLNQTCTWVSPAAVRGPSRPNNLLSPALAAQWVAQLNTLLTIAAYCPDDQAHQAWVDHTERSVALFLLAASGSLPAPAIVPERAGEASGSPRNGRTVVDRLYAYMQSKLGAPVTLDDLVTAAGVSRRQLYVLCARHAGMSPVEWLRQQRLDAARAHLLAKPEEEITGVALQFGFENGGRFAAQYRARFGELPSRTHRRGQPAR
jgi:AraC-like DNA-binding protein